MIRLLQRPIPPIDFLNPRSIAVFVCILQGAIFAALLFRRWSRTRKSSDYWLAVLLLVLISSLITPFIGFANVYDNNQWLTYFPFTIAYSYGALVWLYTANLLDPKRRFEARDLLLFVPSLIYVAIRLALFAQSLEWKDWFGETSGRAFSAFIFVTELVWNLTFLTFSILLYRRYRRWLDENYSDTEKMKFDWLRNFLYFFAAVIALGAAFDFVNSFVVRLSYIQFFYFEIVLALATYALAIAGYLRSEPIGIDFESVHKAEDVPGRQKLMNADELDRHKVRLIELIRSDRPYLDPQLTLGDLAKSLGVNGAVLSFVINNGFGKNFNDFINEFRIDDVKSRITERPSDSLLAIAFDCGFNSKATFNRAFRKFTGSTPKQFQSK